jgi:hypothetical protein
MKRYAGGLNLKRGKRTNSQNNRSYDCKLLVHSEMNGLYAAVREENHYARFFCKGCNHPAR